MPYDRWYHEELRAEGPRRRWTDHEYGGRRRTHAGRRRYRADRRSPPDDYGYDYETAPEPMVREYGEWYVVRRPGPGPEYEHGAEVYEPDRPPFLRHRDMGPADPFPRRRKRRGPARRRGSTYLRAEREAPTYDADFDERLARSRPPRRPARGYPPHAIHVYDLDYGRQAGGPDEYSGRAGLPTRPLDPEEDDAYPSGPGRDGPPPPPRSGRR